MTKGKLIIEIEKADGEIRTANLKMDGRQKVVEVKGFRTRDYMLRRKLFEWQYREYEFEEVK